MYLSADSTGVILNAGPGTAVYSSTKSSVFEACLEDAGGDDEERQYRVVPDGPGTAVYSSTKSGVPEPNGILSGRTGTAAYMSEKSTVFEQGLDDDEEDGEELQGRMVPAGLEMVVYSSANSTALESCFEDGSGNCPAGPGTVVYFFANSTGLDSSFEDEELQGRMVPRDLG